MKTPADIRSYSEDQLKELFSEMQEPAYRAAQVYDWLWNKGVTDFSGMTNLSKALREKLQDRFSMFPMNVAVVQKSSDGTIKVGFRLWDGNIVEGVLIPAGDRMTACVSSQVGCSLSCKFCATGYLERQRNLSSGEIYDQVKSIDDISRREYGQPLSNIVFMGMGEPLLNYTNVMTAIDRITNPRGLGMAAKRITVSTAGISKMIIRMAEEGARFNLALSLHAASDTKRSQLMPINDTNNLESLRQALKFWYSKTQSRPTLEYALMLDANDSEEDALNLVKFTAGIPCKVNLIEYNPIDQAGFQDAGEEKMNAFAAVLTRNKIIVSVRRSRGKDIDAACGQLANKN